MINKYLQRQIGTHFRVDGMLNMMRSIIFIACSLLLSSAHAEDSDAELWGNVDTTEPETASLAVDPGIQMWEIFQASDLWQQPPPNQKVFADFRQGTIDFWVKYDPQWSATEDRGTLVAFSNGYETVFEVGMAANGDGIIMANGKRDGYVHADFTDGQIHHVTVVTAGESSQIFVDGQLVGTVSVGYAIAEDASGPIDNLQLSIGSFDGRTRLFQGQIGALRIWGAPLPALALFEAAKLRDDKLMSLPWAKSFLIAHLENIAGSTGKPQLRFLPPMFRPTGIWMTRKDANRQQKNPGKAPGNSEDWAFSAQSYVQLVMTTPDSVLARYAETMAGQNTGGSNNYQHVPNAAISGYNTKAVSGTVEQCKYYCATERGFECKSFDYHKGKNRCDLSNKRAREIGGLKRNYPGNPYDHYERLPQTNTAASLLSKPGSTYADQRSVNAKLPVVVALTFVPFQSISQPENVVAQVFKPVDRNRYHSNSGQELVLNSRVYLQTAGQRLQRMDKPERPPREDETRSNDVFIIGNQIRGLEFSLIGWDPIKINPFDFSKPEGGHKKNIFTFSPYGYTDRARMIVPKGFELVDLQSGEGRRKHTAVDTESKLQEELGAMLSVGGSFDAVKVAASYSANASFKSKTEKLRAGTSAYTLAQTVNARIALLLDKSNIWLTEPFREAVLQAAKNPSLSTASALVDEYGTHYAHAIVMGGRIIEIVELDAETWGAAQNYEGGVGGAVEMRVGLADTANVKAKLELQMSAAQYESFNSTVTNSKEHWEYSGGSGGASSGFWQVSDENMAPIFLDLRPLAELLAPPMFLEPAVFDTLRPLVNEAMQVYVKNNAGKIQVTPKFVPKNIEKYQLPKPKKACAQDRWTFRGEINTDDKLEGGGVWVQFVLPVAKHFGAKRWEDGCYASSHGDGPLNILLECNRVCWKNAFFTCKDGTWETDSAKITTDIWCHSMGNTSQDGLIKGTGTPPWSPISNPKSWMCELYKPGAPGRPENCAD